LPGGCATHFSVSLREAFSCPAGSEPGRSGCASSAALRPAFACDRAGTSRGGAPRCSPETAPAIPHCGAPARCPHAPASWLHPPAGWSSPPSPRCRLKRSRGPATEPPDPGFNVSSRRVGVSNRQAGASGHASLDRGDPACGPRRGVGDAASCGHRGAPARDALLGRGRGSLGAPRAGASKRRGAAHPLGKRKPAGQRTASRSDKEKASRAPAWQKKTRGAKNSLAQ